MPRNTDRNLPKLADLLIANEELLGGRRIVVAASGGPRLGGKRGIILGPGSTPSQVKVLLDGAQGYVTLHVRFVNVLKSE